MTQQPDPFSELRGLMAGASGSLPWAYRPREHDDWGTIRTVGNGFAAKSRQAIQDERSLDDHRAAKTDPYEPYGRLIVAAVNQAVALLDERDRLIGSEARELMLAEALGPIIMASVAGQPPTAAEWAAAHSAMNAHIKARQALSQEIG